MRGNFLLLLCLSTVLNLVVSQPSRISYQVNEEWSFAVTTNVDSNGYITDQNSRTPGAFTVISGTLVIQCTDQDATSNYFAYNLFDSNFLVGQGTASNYTYSVSGPIDDTMYFQQTYNGSIVNIWYDTSDDPIIVNLRIGLINAFHTHLTGHYDSVQVQETDPVALHNSHFQALQPSRASANVQVLKSFTQNDVIEFADPTVQQHNVQFVGTGSILIDSNGKMMSAAVSHECNLMSVTTSADEQAYAGEDSGNVAMDSVMSSLGKMEINNASPVQLTSDRRLDGSKTRAQLLSSPTHKAGSMFDISKNFIDAVKAQIASEEELTRAVKAVVFQTEEFSLKNLHQLISHLNKAAKKDVKILERVFAPIFAQFSTLENSYEFSQQKLTQLLASIDHEFAHSLVMAALHDKDAKNRLGAVYALSFVKIPNEKLVLELLEISKKDPSARVRHAALLFSGILIRKMKENSVDYRKAASVLFKMMETDQAPASVLLKSIQNTRLTSFDNLQAPSTMPFNVSYAKDLELGGKIVGLNASVTLFAGTNFDCNQPTFNYEALAEAEATLGLFGKTQSLFKAEAAYGKVNGVPADDEIFLSVWNDVIYNEKLPKVDCSEHTQQIGHADPGFSVDYVVWVVIVPVTFKAGASVDVTLSWGWQICDTSLSALVELVPTAVPTLYGEAEIDLYVVKAGVELNGNFAMSIVPQGYVHGSECTIGFDVKQENPSMGVALATYYQTIKCKWIFFDCHYKPTETQTWFSWNYGAQNKVLYDKEWKIAGNQ